MLLGTLIRKWEYEIKAAWQKGIALFGFFVLGVCFLFNGELYLQYSLCSYGSLKNIGLGIVYYIVSIVGVMALLLVSVEISQHKNKLIRLIAKVGSESLAIYVIHMPVTMFLFWIPHQLADKSWAKDIYIAFFALAIVFAIYFSVILIFNKLKAGRILLGKSR